MTKTKKVIFVLVFLVALAGSLVLHYRIVRWIATGVQKEQIWTCTLVSRPTPHGKDGLAYPMRCKRLDGRKIPPGRYQIQAQSGDGKQQSP